MGVEVQVIESADPVGEAEQLLRTAAESGFDLVITLEYSHFDALARVAPDYPDTTFGIVNIEVDQPNVVSILFKEHEGSFLAGALAAMVTSMEGNDKVNEDAVIGVIGGVQSAGIDKFLVGYEEGAQYINPDIEVITAYSESFGDPAKGQELTLAMYEQGADIVYQVAGGTGEGVFTAAEEMNHYAIGVDADQDYIKPGFILTSMLKRVDNAVYDVIARAAAGEDLGGGTIEYGLVEDGVGLSPMEFTKDDIPQEFLDQIADLQAMIESGEIVVTDVTKVEQAPAEEEVTSELPKVAMIIAQGGLGDRSYNDLANSGLERAAAEMGVEVQVIESADPVGEAEQLLRTAAESGFDLVITLEYSHFDALARVAPDYPDTTFGIVNIEVDQPNVVSILFKEHEGSFLAGALAAMVTSMEGNDKVNEDAVIGVIGGVQSAGIDKFLVGYEEGAQYINPDIEVITAYSESFGDPAKGQELTLAMYEQGADIVYQVAGGTGEGVFTAAEEMNHYAIGVDADQDYIKPGFILTSMLKRVDNAVYDVITRAAAGEDLGGGTIEYGLVEDGVGLSPMEFTKDDIPQEFLDQIADLQAMIESGEIVVTDVTK